MYFVMMTNKMSDGTSGKVVCVNMSNVTEFFTDASDGTLLLFNFTTADGDQAFVNVTEDLQEVISMLPDISGIDKIYNPCRVQP